MKLNLLHREKRRGLTVRSTTLILNLVALLLLTIFGGIILAAWFTADFFRGEEAAIGAMKGEHFLWK